MQGGNGQPLSGRERFLDVGQQFQQKRFHTMRALIEKAPYGRLLSQDEVCRLADSASSRDFADGALIMSGE